MPNVRLYLGGPRAVTPFVALTAGGEYIDALEGSWGAVNLYF